MNFINALACAISCSLMFDVRLPLIVIFPCFVCVLSIFYELRPPHQLKEHAKDFADYLEHKGSTADYVNTTKQRVEAILTECKFERINQVSASRVQEYLSDLREKGTSVASSNHYLRTIKMFTRWLVRDRRTTDDRLAHLSKMNEEVDRRRIRRPLSMEEFARLLLAAEKGDIIQNVSGSDRAALYIVGAYTGFRRNEIGSVTQQSFDFDSDPPTLTVAAGYSKHRREDVIPLRSDFAKRIQKWIAGKTKLTPTEPLFDIRDKRTAEMIRIDMQAARKSWIEEASRIRCGLHQLAPNLGQLVQLAVSRQSPRTPQNMATVRAGLHQIAATRSAKCE